MREEFETYNWRTGAVSATKFTDKVTAQIWIEECRLEIGFKVMRNWNVRAIYRESANITQVAT